MFYKNIRSHQKSSIKKVLLQISQNSHENTCARVSFLIRPTTLLKWRLWHRCFPVNFAKFVRTPFFTEHLRWLLLREHKLLHNFRNSLSPICNCRNAIESTKHCLFHCSNSKNERQSLPQNIRIVKQNLLSINEDALTDLLLTGDKL